MEIQVDMFEVQLGAALLLQFRVGTKMVRVLADAGTSMSGYGKNHVLDKLQQVLPLEEGKPPPRIDLLIGTHYDADHLNRMVPIIERYEIGEAWLPPVANDTEPPASDWEAHRESNLLGVQFAGEKGDEKFVAYLGDKAKAIEVSRRVRDQLDEPNARLGIKYESVLTRKLDQPLLLPGEGYFEQALQSACAAIGEHSDHACKDVRPPMTLREIDYRSVQFFTHRMKATHLGDNQIRSLAYIERSAATDALTARSLKQVVDALVAKGVTTRYEYVQDGQPSAFAWNAKERRFVRTRRPRESQLVMTLLGPSRSLIAKYWDRLPIGEYVQFALASRLPVEGITPQNELSYAMVFRHKEQGILVSGDTGFVDFKPLDSPSGDLDFYPAMIHALQVPLSVVQVAHHGGHNKYFYHALQAAKYPVGAGLSHLLLSHEVNGKSRPSKIFAQFMDQLGSKAAKVRLLFTSQPRKAAVSDFVERIASVVPAGVAADRGDIQLTYANNKWLVRKHAIDC